MYSQCKLVYIWGVIKDHPTILIIIYSTKSAESNTEKFLRPDRLDTDIIHREKLVKVQDDNKLELLVNYTSRAIYGFIAQAIQVLGDISVKPGKLYKQGIYLSHI